MNIGAVVCISSEMPCLPLVHPGDQFSILPTLTPTPAFFFVLFFVLHSPNTLDNKGVLNSLPGRHHCCLDPEAVPRVVGTDVTCHQQGLPNCHNKMLRGYGPVVTEHEKRDRVRVQLTMYPKIAATGHYLPEAR